MESHRACSSTNQKVFPSMPSAMTFPVPLPRLFWHFAKKVSPATFTIFHLLADNLSMDSPDKAELFTHTFATNCSLE